MNENEQEQEDIKKLIFSNKIPIMLILNNKQLANNINPLPLYIFFHRIHYPIIYY